MMLFIRKHNIHPHLFKFTQKPMFVMLYESCENTDKSKRRIILLRGNIKRKGGNENEYEMKKRPLTKDDIFSIWAIKTYNCCMYVIQLFFSHSNTVLLNIYSV